jgi:hypothetical protein
MKQLEFFTTPDHAKRFDTHRTSVAGANEKPALAKFHLISLNVIQHLHLNTVFFSK